jgi:hypothetical protein
MIYYGPTFSRFDEISLLLVQPTSSSLADTLAD